MGVFGIVDVVQVYEDSYRTWYVKTQQKYLQQRKVRPARVDASTLSHKIVSTKHNVTAHNIKMYLAKHNG